MNIKEILKIDLLNSKYLMERNVNSSLDQDKYWINFINLNSTELLNYFNNLNGSINNQDDIFAYFIYKKMLFILEKNTINNEEINKLIKLKNAIVPFKEDEFWNFINKNPDTLKVMWNSINIDDEQIKHQWEYKDLLVNTLSEISLYLNEIKNQDLLIQGLIDVDVKFDSIYGFNFYQYKEFIQNCIKNNNGLLKKLLNLKFKNNINILDLIIDSFKHNLSPSLENEMILGVLEFSLYLPKNKSEYQFLINFLNKRINDNLDKFLINLNLNTFNWTTNNWYFEELKKMVINLRSKVDKSKLLVDFVLLENKLLDITAKINLLNKEALENKENFSEFKFVSKIPVEFIKFIQDLTPESYFEQIILILNNAFNKAKTKQKDWSDLFTRNYFNNNGEVIKNHKFINPEIKESFQYDALCNNYYVIISPITLWFYKSENFSYLKELYKNLEILETKKLFDNIFLDENSKINLGFTVKVEKIFNLLLKINNIKTFKLDREYEKIELSLNKKIQALWKADIFNGKYNHVFEYIWWLTCDPMGLNIRNEIAHGNDTQNSVTSLLASLLMFFMLGYIIKNSQ